MKYLQIKEGVVLTSSINKTIGLLEPYFTKAEYPAIVTSGYRSPEHQLEIIKEYSIEYGLSKKFPEILTCRVEDKADSLYAWQKAWSGLLNIGIIINPPISAKCLFDYIKNGHNKKGWLFPASPHTKGTDFDISGGKDINKIESIIKEAYISHKANIKYYVVELKNNCLHIGGG